MPDTGCLEYVHKKPARRKSKMGNAHNQVLCHTDNQGDAAKYIDGGCHEKKIYIISITYDTVRFLYI